MPANTTTNHRDASSSSSSIVDTLALEPYTPDDASTAATDASTPAAGVDASAPRTYASAASYRQGAEIQLTNGEWVRLRPRSLMTLIRTKKVPNSLIGAANRMLANTGRATPTGGANTPQDPRQGEGQLELQDFLVTELVASLHIVMESEYTGADDEVCVADMFEADKNAIIAYAMQGQKALTEFRQQ